jgi:hypothetical protein
MNEEQLIEFLKNNLRIEIITTTVFAKNSGDWFNKDQHQIKLFIKDELIADALTHTNPAPIKPKNTRTRKLKPVSYESIKSRST